MPQSEFLKALLSPIKNWRLSKQLLVITFFLEWFYLVWRLSDLPYVVGVLLRVMCISRVPFLW